MPRIGPVILPEFPLLLAPMAFAPMMLTLLLGKRPHIRFGAGMSFHRHTITGALKHPLKDSPHPIIIFHYQNSFPHQNLMNVIHPHD